MDKNVTVILDTAAGKAQRTQGQSLGTFIASLTASGVILLFGGIAYTVLRFVLPNQYQEHTYDLPWKPTMPSLLTFLRPLLNPRLINKKGLNNYLLNRYLHTLTRIFTVLGLFLCPLLLPLNIINGKNAPGGVKGLDRLTFSNVGLDHTSRYWGHLVGALLVVSFVCLTLERELKDYYKLYRALDMDLPSGSNIIVVSSQGPISHASIRRHFGKFAGGVSTIVINRDYSDLHRKIQQRESLVLVLEVAASNFIRSANNRGITSPDRLTRPVKCISKFSWLPALPVLSTQVDAIIYYSKEIAKRNLQIEEEQRDLNRFPLS